MYKKRTKYMARMSVNKKVQFIIRSRGFSM